MPHLTGIPEIDIFIASLALCLGVFLLNWERRTKWYLYASLIVLFIAISLVLFILHEFITGARIIS